MPIKNGGIGGSGNNSGGHVPGTESDDSSIRSVRFSKLAEVREMSPHEATEALMSRLSYAASMRIRRQKTNNKTARTALMFCILVSAFRTFNWVTGVRVRQLIVDFLLLRLFASTVVCRKLFVPIGLGVGRSLDGIDFELNFNIFHINFGRNLSILKWGSILSVQASSCSNLYKRRCKSHPIYLKYINFWRDSDQVY